MASRDPRPPVLRPAAPPARPALGTGTPAWAAVGLAALLFVTLPAVFEHTRLAHEHAELEAEVRQAEARLNRLRREASDEPTVRYLREKTTRRIARDGRRYLRRRHLELRRGGGR